MPKSFYNVEWPEQEKIKKNKVAWSYTKVINQNTTLDYVNQINVILIYINSLFKYNFTPMQSKLSECAYYVCMTTKDIINLDGDLT